MARFMWFLLWFYMVINIIDGSSVRNVRLVDHTSYAIKVLDLTMKKVEERHWCNLKVDDVVLGINETVLATTLTGDIDFTNGFLISMRSLDIVQNTVQQVWLPVSGNTTTVEVRATMRIRDAAIGFDVLGRMTNGDYRSSGIILYPEIQFPFTIVKDLFTDEITASVLSTVVRTTNLMNFMPINDVTKVAAILFDWNCTAESVRRWATDVFTPITLDVATNEVNFPTICYNCAVS